MKRPSAAILLISLLTVVFAAFLFYPMAFMLRAAFFPGGRLSLAFFHTLAANPMIREAIRNSLALAAAATAVSALLAIPLAVAATRCRFPGRSILSGLLLLPMIMPPFVGAIGMRQFLARFGSINLLLLDAGILSQPIDWLGAARFWGVVVVMALHLYPILYLNLSAALANVDPSLQEASANLGASPMRTFRRVTLPLAMPGLFAGCIIVFISAFTDLGTPLVFEYRRVAAVLIFDRITDTSNNPEGPALVVLMLLLTLGVFLAARRAFGTASHATFARMAPHARELQPGPVASALLTMAFLAVIAMACLPHLSVILTSLRARWFMTVLPEDYTLSHYVAALSHPLTLPSIRNSIVLSSFSTGADLALGIAIAFLLARTRLRARPLLDAAAMLPLAVPGLVLAFGYLMGFAGTPIDPRRNPTVLLVVAYAVRRLPYMVRAAYAGFLQVSVTLEEAAINLGSTRFRAVRRITLPLISANLIAGAVLTFAFAMLEVSDSLILALREQHYPITKAIYQLLSRIEDGASIASALGVWAMTFLALSILAASLLLGRRLGQIFRA